MKLKMEIWATRIFFFACIFISFLLVETVVLTLIHQFKQLFLYFSLIPASILAFYISFHINKDIDLIPKITIPVLLVIFLISLLLIIYPHDTFGGRDEAMYINTAMYLTDNTSLEYPTYLNDLNDKYVESVRTMPPAYSAWLATQQTFFGIQGLLRGNLILIILGLGLFSLVSCYLGGEKIGLIATILLSSSMPFLWFSRETMSENLSFFLLWLLIFFFLLILKSKRVIYIILVCISSWLFAFTRLEGYILQFLLLIIIPSTLLFLKITSKKNIIYISSSLLIIVVSNVLMSSTTSGLSLTQVMPFVNYSLKRDVSALLPKIVTPDIAESIVSSNGEKVVNLYDKMTVFFVHLLTKYNLFLVIFSIFVVSIKFIIQKKRFSPTKIYFFVIILILIPEVYKLISPGVTIDEPWLYRRYVYALLPFGYMSLGLLLINYVGRKSLIFIVSGFLLINIILSRNIIFIRNDWGLMHILETISNDISSEDFVIIKDRPLGDYSPFTYLVLQRGIRSEIWYNLNSLNFSPGDKTIHGVSYDRLFLLSPNENDSYLSFETDVRMIENVKYTQLKKSCQLNLLGEEIGLANSYNIGILPFSNVIKYCSKPENEIIHHDETIYLYELLYDKK